MLTIRSIQVSSWPARDVTETPKGVWAPSLPPHKLPSRPKYPGGLIRREKPITPLR